MARVLDFEGVRRLLPQTHPFVFIDRVLAFEPYRWIECLKNVSGNEPYFAGHFPQMAIMPGALIMEASAQASILLFRLSSGEDSARDAGEAAGAGSLFVVGTSRSRFLHPVFPGDALRLTVEVEKLLSRAARVRVHGEVEKRAVLKATLGFARVDAGAITGAARPESRR